MNLTLGILPFDSKVKTHQYPPTVNGNREDQTRVGRNTSSGICTLSNAINLWAVELEELSQRVGSQSGRADEARRARWMLVLDAGRPWALTRDKLDCTGTYMGRAGQAVCTGTPRGAV